MRRLIISIFLLVGGIAFAGATNKQETAFEADVEKIKKALCEIVPVKPAKSRKVLVFSLCKGFYHESIPYWSKAIELMGKKTSAFEPVISGDMSVFDADNLKQFDAIIFNNTTKLVFTPDQRQHLMDFVKSGKGIVGVHAATDNFDDWPEAAAMMGGLFDSHPWGSGGTWAVKNEEPAHPLNKAFAGKDFKISDEIYAFKGPYSRKTHRVLLSIDLSDASTGKAGLKGQREDKDYAVSWIKRCGEGRVFCSSFGHHNHITWNAVVLQHYLDGIQYALGDLQVDDTPSAELKPK